ncbi:hypothetical protein ACFE04_016663 [Oxalis oulophora]
MSVLHTSHVIDDEDLHERQSDDHQDEEANNVDQPQSEKKINRIMLKKPIKLTKLIRLRKLAAHNAKKVLDVDLPPGPALFQVDPIFFDYENELRRIFASKVVKSFDKSNPATPKHLHLGSRATDCTGKKTILVSPSEDWAPWDDSLSMEYLQTKGGCRYFRYVPSSSCDEAQKVFEAAIANHDFESIAYNVQKHPYHLDSLLTMAKYLNSFSEPEIIEAFEDCIAKCLYALESAWHPKFTPFKANCQLKLSEKTNKPLFEALSAHMRVLDRRGCHRTALEVCKLLLSLDFDEPGSAFVCVDYYALRAEEYQWLEKFSEEYEYHSSLWTVPNFPYSLALCRHHLESTNVSQLDSTKSLSADLMKQALMLYPQVLKKLVAEVPLKGQVWTRILQSSIFRADEINYPSLDILIDDYVKRNCLMWRSPDVQKLLQDSALFVIEAMEHGKHSAEDWARVRRDTFSAQKTECCLMSVEEINSVLTILPEGLQNCMDPRMTGFNVDPRMTRGRVRDRNSLASLLEVMVPWPGISG